MVVLVLIFKNHGLSDWNVRLLDHVINSYPQQQRQETKQMKKKHSLYLLGPSRKTQGNFTFLRTKTIRQNLRNIKQKMCKATSRRLLK